MKRLGILLSSLLFAPLLATGCVSGSIDGSNPDGTPATGDSAALAAAQRAAAAQALTADLRNIMMNLTPQFATANLNDEDYCDGVEVELRANLTSGSCFSVDLTDGFTVAFAGCDLAGTLIDGTLQLSVDINVVDGEASLLGGTDGLIVGANTVSGSFDITASLLERSVTFESSLDASNSELDIGFTHSIWSETTFDGGVLVHNSEVGFNTLAGDQPLSLSIDDVTYDVGGLLTGLAPGVCPDSGSISVASADLSGEAFFNPDGTVTLFVNGEEVPFAADVCNIADMFIAMSLP